MCFALLRSALCLRLQDALLLHIVPIYDAKDWVSIAKHMGGEVTNEQCRNRWTCKVDPSLHACKAGPWEPEEVRMFTVYDYCTALPLGYSTYCTH